MLRNLLVTGVVSVVMGVTTLAFRSLAPPEAQPTMGTEASPPQAETGDQADQPASPLGGQTGQTGQIPAMPSTSIQTPGGAMGSGQAGGGMMMCPCMQMMMGGGMDSGMTAGSMNVTAQSFSNPRTKEEAQQRAQQYLNSLGNPNLKVGEVNETAASYEIEVLTKDGSLVNHLIIDKKSGEMKSQY